MRITLIGPLLALCVVASSSAHAVERGPASMPQPNPMPARACYESRLSQWSMLAMWTVAA